MSLPHGAEGWIATVAVAAVAVCVLAGVAKGIWHGGRWLIGIGVEAAEAPSAERRHARYRRVQWWLTSLTAACALWVVESEAVRDRRWSWDGAIQGSRHAFGRAFRNHDRSIGMIALNVLVVGAFVGLISHLTTAYSFWRERAARPTTLPFVPAERQQDAPLPPDRTAV